ncbi:hypothetical protein V494_07468 [Pseudogymnoascus sp. VKM F-4513 (FW-928)]|nr:hypothetical protein V494_07468 [Pseudogymnoascus sp. VKM F-4513 (FW-928)]
MACGSLLKLLATASAAPVPEAEQSVDIQANRALRNAPKLRLSQFSEDWRWMDAVYLEMTESALAWYKLPGPQGFTYFLKLTSPSYLIKQASHTSTLSTQQPVASSSPPVLTVDWHNIEHSILVSSVAKPFKMALDSFFHNKIESMKLEIIQGQAVLRRLEAQRNDYNSRVRLLREELGLLQQPGSYVGEVVKVMGTKKVLVKVHPEGKYVVDISDNVDITKLTVGKRVTLLSDSYKLEKMLPSSVDPLVSLMMVEKVPDSTYDMIGGLDQQIKEIKEVIELGLKHPELFESLGIAQPKGVLLYGPPGTGKTLLARAVAHHTDCKFIRVSGSELVQKYIGEGSRMVRELFVMAREHAPSIIFMDEIDSIGSSRVEGSSGGDSEVQRTMLELLNQLDGFEPTKNIKVIMATNRLDILDPALLRPGRIDRKIEFPPPTVEARADILRIHSRKMNLTRGINLTKIAEKMNGCSGAELKGVCTEAGMFALRERRVHVTQEDFDLATAKVLNKHDDKEVSLGKLWK